MTTDVNTPKDIPESVRRILSVPKGKYDVPTFITYRRNGIRRHVIVDIGEPVIKEAWREWCRYNPSADPEAFLLVVYSLTRHEIPRLYRAVGTAELTPPTSSIPTVTESMDTTYDDTPATPDSMEITAVPAETQTSTITVEDAPVDIVIRDTPETPGILTIPDTHDTPSQSTLDVQAEIKERKRKKVNKVREIPDTTE